MKAYSLEDQLRMSLHAVQAWKRAKVLPRRNVMESTAIVRQETGIVVPLEFTPEQYQMIRDTYASGASEKEFQVLMEVAKLRRLNPLFKQIHFMQRWNPDLERKVWVSVVGIDGFRAIADRTGRYAGQDEPEFGPFVNGFPESCRVRVYRKDWKKPAVGVAYWSEYVQVKRDGKPTRSWSTMPHTMIAKCAEAQAMRKAFPEDLGGLYVDEELQAGESGEIGDLNNPRAMHSMPGEDPDARPRESSEYDSLMCDLRAMDTEAFDPGCTWHSMTTIRGRLGSKGKPTQFSQRLSDLYRSEAIAPAQRKDLAALWNRVDRKLTQLEGKLKPPPVEASFTDGPEDDTDAFSPAAESEEA